MAKSHTLCFWLMFLPAIVLMLVCAGSVNAANTLHSPEQGKFLIGVHIREVNSRDIFEHDDRLSDELDLTYRYLEASYGIFDDLAVDLRFGSAKYDVSWIEYGRGLAWGLGLRTKLFRWEEQNVVIGAGFRYDRYNPDDALRHGNYFSTDPDEWNISIEVAKFFSRFGITGGIEYSEVTLPFEHPERRHTREGGFKQDNEFGLYFGMEAMIIKKLGITGEIHLIADRSYSLGIFYKF